MASKTTTTLTSLSINTVPNMTTFNTMKSAGQVNENELYFIGEDSAVVTDIWYSGSTAPSNTKLLWIDTDTTTGGLKYYDGSSWVHVPVAWG